MNRSRSTKLAVGAVAAFACAMSFGCGVATASPDVSGKTYDDAQAALQQAGFTAVPGTVFGDKLSQSDCTVIGQRERPTGMTEFWPNAATPNGVFIGASGGSQQHNGTAVGFPTSQQVVLTLSCYRANDAGPGQATGSGDIHTANTNSQ